MTSCGESPTTSTRLVHGREIGGLLLELISLARPSPYLERRRERGLVTESGEVKVETYNGESVKEYFGV